MSFLPKVKRCPCCSTLNIFRVNGMSYENNYQSLKEWTLKKTFECRKCKEEIGLFINNINPKKERTVWFSFLNCEDSYYDKLIKLQKIKINSKKENKKYLYAIEQIRKIQNEIQINKTKLKIKIKIENKGVLIRNVY